jgi:2,3-dihydroxybenzoate decarboxylase
MSGRSKAIVLEEHFLDAAFAEKFGIAGPPSALLGDRAAREDELDAQDIALEVLSHAPPAAQALPPDQAEEWSRRINDGLKQWIDGSSRFAGFASLPLSSPEAAARELERCVRDLGFCGAMIHGMTDGRMPDDHAFHDLMGVAEALDVPLYLHPSFPHPDVAKVYYQDYMPRFPMFAFAAAGFTCEMMVIAIRMMLSEIPEKFPKLKLVLGHMGEAIPFLMERIDESLARDVGGRRFFRERFLRHFTVTTSGNFSDAALACAIAELGAERIMFSIDFPYVAREPGRAWIDAVNIDDASRTAILNGNATRLLKRTPQHHATIDWTRTR